MLGKPLLFIGTLLVDACSSVAAQPPYAVAPAADAAVALYANAGGAWGAPEDGEAWLRFAAGAARAASVGNLSFAVDGVQFDSGASGMIGNRDQLLTRRPGAAFSLQFFSFAVAGKASAKGIGVYVSPASQPKVTDAALSLTASSACVRVFWSGSAAARGAAERFAARTGVATLEMTDLGRALEDATESMPWNTQGKPAFAAVSKLCAANSSGTVHVFQSMSGVKVDSLWARVEYPELINNVHVDAIVYHPTED